MTSTWCGNGNGSGISWDKNWKKSHGDKGEQLKHFLLCSGHFFMCGKTCRAHSYSCIMFQGNHTVMCNIILRYCCDVEKKPQKLYKTNKVICETLYRLVIGISNLTKTKISLSSRPVCLYSSTYACDLSVWMKNATSYFLYNHTFKNVGVRTFTRWGRFKKGKRDHIYQFCFFSQQTFWLAIAGKSVMDNIKCNSMPFKWAGSRWQILCPLMAYWDT